MSRANVLKEEIVEGHTSYLALYLETKNSSFLLMSEGEDKLGTLAVAIPQPQKLVGPPLSSILLGDRNIMVTRLLAELLAKNINKMALVSVFIKTLDEKEAGPILKKLMEKILRKEENGK